MKAFALPGKPPLSWERSDAEVHGEAWLHLRHLESGQYLLHVETIKTNSIHVFKIPTMATASFSEKSIM